MNNLYFFIAAFLSTVLITPVIIKFSHKNNLLEYPKENSTHTKPMPMFGGVIIFSVFFAVSFIANPPRILMPFFLAAIPVFLGGLYDDFKGLKASQKLLLQFISSIIFISCGVIVHSINVPLFSSITLGHLSIPFTIIWFVFIMNLINIIDGLDGLASGLSAIVFLVLLTIVGPDNHILGSQLLIIMGSVLAFLMFNFYPAKIFLGNNGSSFLGLAVAYFSIITSQKSTVLPILAMPLGILFIQVLDIGYSMLRRMKKGVSVFKGDKEHFHHISLKRFKNYRLVILSFYFISLLSAAILLKVFIFNRLY